MRQTLLMLAIVVGSSPLAMAQDPVGAATSSVVGTDASRQPAAAALVAAPRAASPQDHANPAPKPVSAIGRALAERNERIRAAPPAITKWRRPGSPHAERDSIALDNRLAERLLNNLWKDQCS